MKRLLLMIPILLIVHFATFALFFIVNSPDDIARKQLGNRMVTQLDLKNWKEKHGYHLPLFVNHAQKGPQKIVQTLFYQETIHLLHLNFGLSITGKNIGSEIKKRIFPSLAIAIPSFILGILLNLLIACILVFFRNTHLNIVGLMLSICFLSVSTLFYIIFAQYYLAYVWRWFPISGYEPGFAAISFILLPVITHLFAGLGSGTRWYRALLLEEIEQFYISTARANGISETNLLIHYALRNALLPIVTGVVVIIPSLFLGSILFESFFSIPGLGDFLFEALQNQDFPVVRTMVFLGSLSYLIGLLLTDISYSLVDPRVRIQ